MAWFDHLKTPKIKVQESQNKSRVPEGLWIKCSSCSEVLQSKALKSNQMVCTECDYHFRLNAVQRIDLLVGETKVSAKSKKVSKQNYFQELAADLVSTDPLGFEDQKFYKDRLKAAATKTQLGDALVAGKASIDGVPYYLGVFEFQFMGGSMGVVVGEKITLLFEKALKELLPVVIVSSSGGARMQEGALSLMQMAKTTALVHRLREKGIPFISVLTDPTTGGVCASFAMLGDVIIAEPRALIGFAGPRVIRQTIRKTLPEGFQTSEFLLEHGLVDRIVERKHLSHELKEWMLRLGRNTCRFPKGI